MSPSSTASPLKSLKSALQAIAQAPSAASYRVPGLWVPVGQTPEDGRETQTVNPAAFFLGHIEAIEAHALPGIDPLRSLNSQIAGGDGGAWVTEKPIFNLMVRLASAFDHNGDGVLGGAASDPTCNASGFRETGTFLKSLALLGYIHSLGVGTIHLLPITAIGRDGNKGLLGSPYAIKNPYQLEATQADPLVPLTVEEQFQAFVEAAHLLGIHVVLEFVFRTASKDSDWIREHPDWFYWIDAAVSDRAPGEADPEVAKASYGNPIFEAGELQLINDKVACGDFNALPPPSAQYRGFFKLPPSPEKVILNAAGQMRGMGRDPQSGQEVEVRIPGAFADWPPDDTQPPWGDVTYLRMFVDEHPHEPRFNYIAYNTIRMYDAALARDTLANRPLWDRIRDLIPTYQETYGIDGVMVDMGHAVPVPLMREIVAAARARDPNFAFLSEDFSIEETSVKAGYNAVVGYAWWVEYKQTGMAGLLDHVGCRGVPIAFFGAVENHNTPRAASRDGGERYAKYAFLVNTMLPQSIPFIHAGFELGETLPVNTGLDFSPAAMDKLRGKPLPLFDPGCLSWEGSHPMLSFTRKVLSLRREFAGALAPRTPDSFVSLQSGNPDVFAFLRRGGGKDILVMFNRHLEHDLPCVIDLRGFAPPHLGAVRDLLAADGGAQEFPLSEGLLHANLPAGSCYFCAW